jgi:hypothetical protein
MVDPPSEFPTPEQVAGRLRIVRQLYDLGLALRRARFVDGKPTEDSAREDDRVRDVRSEWTVADDPPPGDRSAS